MSRIEIGGRCITTIEIRDLLETDHPMVAEFRFVRTQGYREGLSFALQIIPRPGVRYRQQRDAHGRRIQPTWKTLDGQESLGQANRAIYLDGDELVAENCTFFPNQEFNDLGIGSALYVAMERLYRHLGIRRVTLLAVDAGVYVWARQGFAFAAHGEMAGLVQKLQRFVREQSATVDLESRRFQDSWDVANYDLPGMLFDDYRAGKAFMLKHASPWYGIKFLDEARHTTVAERSRAETFARLPDKIEGAPASLAVV